MVFSLLTVVFYAASSLGDKYISSKLACSAQEFSFLVALSTSFFLAFVLPFTGWNFALTLQRGLALVVLVALKIAEFYTKVFFEDLNKLNIGKPEIIAKATEHIKEMIDYVQKLVEKGYGYEIDDGIYFDISKFPGYGTLSSLDLDEQQAGARVEVNSQKRHPADFALWKKAEPEHIM